MADVTYEFDNTSEATPPYPPWWDTLNIIDLDASTLGVSVKIYPSEGYLSIRFYMDETTAPGTDLGDITKMEVGCLCTGYPCPQTAKLTMPSFKIGSNQYTAPTQQYGDPVTGSSPDLVWFDITTESLGWADIDDGLTVELDQWGETGFASDEYAMCAYHTVFLKVTYMSLDIEKIHGVTTASLDKVHGTALTSITEIHGVA